MSESDEMKNKCCNEAEKGWCYADTNAGVKIL